MKICIECGSKKSDKGDYCKKCSYKHRTRHSGLKYKKHKENPTSFKKGQIPWNKNTKGIIKPNKGSFKKGEHRSPSTEFKRFNLIKQKANTYQARKSIREYYNKKWNELNLPENPEIHHIDGNIFNNNFNNLCVMSKKEHGNFHRGHIA